MVYSLVGGGWWDDGSDRAQELWALLYFCRNNFVMIFKYLPLGGDSEALPPTADRNTTAFIGN
jgi:hypothetical protein